MIINTNKVRYELPARVHCRIYEPASASPLLSANSARTSVTYCNASNMGIK
jgi:hypothetical protein